VINPISDLSFAAVIGLAIAERSESEALHRKPNNAIKVLILKTKLKKYSFDGTHKTNPNFKFQKELK